MRPVFTAFYSLFLAALFSLNGGARSAEPDVDAAAISKSDEVAEKAALAELYARPMEAAELYLQAATLQAAAAARDADAEKAAAGRAEIRYLAEKACALAESRQFRGRLVEPLRGLDKLTAKLPELNARVAWMLANGLRAAGDLKSAAKEFRRLGFVVDWQVIGPFDNERGQGFDQPYPPESSIDLAKSFPGKKRKVAWQRAFGPNEDGYVDLAGMLRPNEEAVAYLLTYLEVDGKKDLPAAIRLASDDGVKVWLNGREVWKLEVQRPATFDQDCFGVTLRPGANSLLVKVAQAGGEWGLRLRLSDPAGAPLKGVTARADRAYETAAPAAGEAPEVERGAEAYFKKRAKANPQDFKALARLAFLTARAAAFDHDRGGRPDRALLEAAVKAEPANARLWYELAAAAASGGEMSAETDDNPRRRALEQSLKLAPSAAAELELAAHYLRLYRNFTKAGAHLERARALAPDSLEAGLLAVEMSAAREDDAEAFAAAEVLAKTNPQNARAQAAFAALLENAGNHPAAAEARAAALKRDYGEGTLRALADAWLRSGQTYKALGALEEILALRPGRVELRAERARLLAGRGDFAAAIDECQKGLAVCREDHKLLAALGEYLAATNQKPRAREAWRQALELQPNFADLERYVEYVEGRVSYDRKHREPTAELLAAAPGVVSTANEGGAYLLNKVIDRVYPDGTTSRTAHALVKVLSDAGARRFAEERVFFNADEQRAVIRTARVIRTDGREEQARILSEQVFPEGERSRGVRVVRFPPLSAGDVVEFEYRVDGLQQGFFGRYFGDTFLFQQDLPVGLAKYVLIVPAGLEVHFKPVRCNLQPEVRPDQDDGATVFTWTARNQPRIDIEPFMPPLTEISPGVEVSTYKDWGSFGKWYWGLVKKQHEAGPEARRLAGELCAGAKTDLDKIRAIYNYVVTDIRYVAWEFGVHGFKPYRAEQILARKFGDCKDKATLICSLLAEQGITAHPVLIRAEPRREKQPLDLPLISNFNHCIVYVPAAGARPELWLDGTAQYCSIDDLLDTDRGARVAVITPEGAEIKDIPPSGSGMNSTADQVTLKLAADGSARGAVRLAATGNRAMVCRYLFDKREERGIILSRRYGRRFQGAEVPAANFSALRDLNVPVSGSFGITIPALGRRTPEGLLLDLPENPLRGSLGYDNKDDFFAAHFTTYAPGNRRTYDVVLPSAWQHSTHCEVELPEGLAPAELPPNAKVDTEFGQLTITRKLDGNKLIVDKFVALAATRIGSAKYEAFRAFCLEVDRLEGERVLLVPAKKAGKNGPPPPEKPAEPAPAPAKEGE